MRLACILLLIFPLTIPAQKKDSTLAAERKRFADSLRALQKELTQSVEAYKASLRELLEVYEKELDRSKDRLGKTKALHDAALISGREVVRDTEAVADCEKRIAAVKEQLAKADDEVKNLEDPDELAKKLITRPAKRERTPTGKVYYVRFIIIGEVAIYDYSGAVRGRVIKQGQRVRYDSRK